MIKTKYNKEFNRTKNRNTLPNRGLPITKILFRKKIKIGYDDKYPIYLECEIKEIDLTTQAIYNAKGTLLYVGNTKETIDHKKINKYEIVSISGHSKNFAGQIYDTLLNDKNIRLIDIKGVKRIIKLWKKHHLNDVQPNCIHQNSLDCNVNNYSELAKKETKKCPKKYEYGSKWLIKKIPQKELNKIQHAFNHYEEVKQK